jgi:hypothetical protein
LFADLDALMRNSCEFTTTTPVIAEQNNAVGTTGWARWGPVAEQWL